MGELAAFVPRLAIEFAERGGSHGAAVDGSMLSADISGFTALSERLAGRGKAGAEEITELVNECFVALIDAAYRFDGEVLKFGGDAILVLFRGDEHRARCGAAGLAMQAALAASRAATGANLSMSVGAADGPFEVFLAGTSVRELLVVGPAASEVVRLEGAAERGETLVSPSIAAALPQRAAQRSHDGGVVVAGSVGEVSEVARDERDVDDDVLTTLIAPQVVEQLDAFAELGGEHRLVSVAFAMVTGLDRITADWSRDDVAEALGALVDDLVAAIEPFGVTLLHTDIAPDGFKAILTAGAPVNPGDIGDAALQAALAVAAIDAPFECRLGVQTGRVFAGFLGAPYRRTYTVMGDPVNTAARLLGKADDRDVIATMTVVDDTRSIFETEAIEPFRVKGKAEPLEAAKVLAATDSARRAASALRLYGRRDELEAIARAVGELGETIDLVGPAGVGKSRLVDAAWDVSEGLTTFRGACTPYGAGSPYAVFRSVLRSGTGIDLEADAEEAGAALAELVADVAPDLLPMLPMLAVPFGATVPSTPEAELVDADFRRLRIHETVLAFLDAVLDGPVLLVVEDMHWIDEASGELVSYLLRAASTRSWAAVTTRRPEGRWRPDDTIPNLRTVRVGPLDDAAIRELCIAASDRPLSDTEIESIASRSDGNPLFVIELARAAGSSSLAELPDTVEAVIAERIDDLEPDDRHLVRVASVFGNRFALADLGEIAGVTAASGRADLVGERLVDFFEPLAEGELGFTHALYRDVAYAGLPFRQRRELHARIGSHLEARSGTDEEAALLSLHFSEAGDHRRTWQYSVVAGRHALDQYATAEAAVVYERAHRAGAKLRDLATADRIDIATRLADACVVTGRFDTARRVIAAARRLEDSVVGDTELMRRLGSIEERSGRLRQALSWYTRALNRIPESTADPAELSSRAKLLLATAGIMHRRGDNHRCARVSHEALADAERAQDDVTRANAFERLHLAHVFTRSRYADSYGDAALAAYEERGDLNGQVKVLNNAGISAYFGGDWTLANHRYQRAAELGNLSGAVVDGGSAALNSGEILSDQGHWDRALDMFSNARRNWEAVGYATGVAVAELYEGVAHMRRGDVESASLSMKIALNDLQTLTTQDLVDDAEARLIELDLSMRRNTPLADANRLLARVAPDSPLRPRVVRSQAVALVQAGDESAAIDQLRSLLGEMPDPTFERLLTIDVLATLGAADDALRREHAEIAAALGVVQLPAVPLRAGRD